MLKNFNDFVNENFSISEDFGTRVAINDLGNNDKVKEAIINDFLIGLKSGGCPAEDVKKITDILEHNLGDVYFDIKTLEVEFDGDPINAISEASARPAKEIADAISNVLKKLPKDLLESEAISEAGPTKTTVEKIPSKEEDLDWTKVGEEYKDYRDKILKIIKDVQWYLPTGSFPMGQGMAIKNVIREFKVPKVDKVGYSQETFGTKEEPGASYSIVAVQGNYKDGPVRIYAVDAGNELVPVATHKIAA